MPTGTHRATAQARREIRAATRRNRRRRGWRWRVAGLLPVGVYGLVLEVAAVMPGWWSLLVMPIWLVLAGSGRLERLPCVVDDWSVPRDIVKHSGQG